MSRIRWSMKSEKGAVHVDVPSGLNGNPVVLTGRIADGSSYGPEYLDAAEQRTCLDRAVALATLLILSALLGCGGAESSQTTGAGGGGGASSSVTSASRSAGSVSASGSSGSGGAASTDEEIGEGTCDAVETPIGPLDGEASDSMGQPIHEDGAMALLRVTTPTPWTATALTYGLSTAGVCAYTDHEVVAFVGPAGLPPPQHPAGASVTTVLASAIVDEGGGATVTTALASPVTVHAGEVLWVGVRMHIESASARTCVYACDDVAPPGDPASWFSAVNAAAKVDLCPESSCDLNTLGTSPDPVSAEKFNNDTRRWPFVVTGHK